MSEFKRFKVMVRSNIQLLIDNKESIEKHGLASLELRSRERNREVGKSAEEEIVEDLVGAEEREKETNAIELNEIFDKEHILEVILQS